MTVHLYRVRAAGMHSFIFATRSMHKEGVWLYCGKVNYVCTLAGAAALWWLQHSPSF